MSRSRRLMLVAAVLPALSGCFTVDAKLDAAGAGSMTVSYIVEESALPLAKEQLEGPHVTVKSAEWKDGRGIFTLTFDDVRKLSTSKYFESTAVELGDGEQGSKNLTVTIRNSRPMKVAPETVAKMGKEVHVSIELPGEIVSSNSTSSKGPVATWTFPTEEFIAKPETVLKVSFKTGSHPA